MRTHRESDPEGLLPDIEVMTEMDEHDDHRLQVEKTETLADNFIEVTEHGWCHRCKKDVRISSITIVGEWPDV